MTLKLQAVFDGQAFRPREPVALEPDTACELTIETESTQLATMSSDGYEAGDFDALTAIAVMAVDMGITDLADRHHLYAHPVPPEE